MSDGAPDLDRPRGGKGREAFRTISEVADELDLPQHVLRFWESKFTQIKPLKRGGNRRYYRPDDVTLLRAIKKLLHSDGYTIRGVQKLFKAQGVKSTVMLALDMDGADTQAPPVRDEGGSLVSHQAEKEAAQTAAEARTEASSEAGTEAGEASSADHGVSVSDLRAILNSLKALRARLN